MAASRCLSAGIGGRLDRMSLLAALFLTALVFAVLLFTAASARAAENVKIYRSTMPDGSTVLSDKPPAGARAVASGTYVLSAPRGAAEAERDYWRRQSEAFNLRQQQREADAARRRAEARRADEAALQDRQVSVPGYANGYFSLSAIPHAGWPLLPLHRTPWRHMRPSARAL